MREKPKRFQPPKKGHIVWVAPIMYSPMSRVHAPAGDPWWLPYERLLLAHLTQPFQLHLHQLPVYWAMTECCVQPHCYWKGFVIWEMASNKVQKAHAATYVSYRFQLHGAIEAERPCVISWMRPLRRDCAVLCVGVAVLTHWRIGHAQAFSPRLLTPAISCEIRKDFPSAHTRWVCAELICAAEEAEFGLIFTATRGRSVAGSVKVCWSEGYRACPQQLPE